MDSYFIPYKNKGGVIVDWDFQSIIHCLPWHDNVEKYPVTSIYLGNRKYKTIKMHKIILDYPEITDHINRNTHDNRTSNLREVTTRMNSDNRKDNGVGSGINWLKHLEKFQLEFMYNGNRNYLGIFVDFISPQIIRRFAIEEVNGHGR